MQYSRVLAGVALLLAAVDVVGGDQTSGQQAGQPAGLVDWGEGKKLLKPNGSVLVPGRIPTEVRPSSLKPRSALNELGGAAPAPPAPGAPPAASLVELAGLAPELGEDAVKALNTALNVVGKSGSEQLRKIVKSFEPEYMLAGGTSQAKDSLMMMLMGLPFAFQAGGIGTRVPCLYRTFKSENASMEVTMRYHDGLSQDGEVSPESVVGKIEEHMGKYATPKPGRFGEDPIEILVSGPELQGAVYKNMMGRVVGRDPESVKNSRDIDEIYKHHVSSPNVQLIAVEKAQTNPANSMIAPFASQIDPTGKRTIWVKTWADYGISEKSAESGSTCREVQNYFREMDFEKPPGSPPTFWIATVEAKPYLQDPSLSFEERRKELENNIAKKEAKMQAFIDGWKAKGCFFDFEDNIKVTKLRKYLSDRHGQTITAKLPELIQALERAKESMDEQVLHMKDELESMPGGDSPSSELLQLMITYKALFDEQMMGERSPPAAGLSYVEVQKIQESEFHTTAAQLATELLASWRERGNPEHMDEAFDRRLEEVARMLNYPQAKQKLSITGHHWTHITNMYMLLVRSLRDLIERRPLTWNLGAVGIAGPNLCNAAAREARDVFMTQTSKFGQHLMVFGMQWLLEKHQRVVRKLLMAMPRNSAYASDAMLNAELDEVEQFFLEKWTRDFSSSFDVQLSKAALNIQQFKIQNMLNNMGKGAEGATTNTEYAITACSDVPGAELQATWLKTLEFPLCRCSVEGQGVFCGTERAADRSFNATVVRAHPACAYNEPYCAKAPQKHELRDLAVLLDPVPKDCGSLYDELIDSSVDDMVMWVGTEMYHMLHGTRGGILKHPALAVEMYNKLKGQKTEDYVAKAFPSLGQRRLLSEKMEKTKVDVEEITGALAYFQDALTSGKNILA